MNGTLDNQAEAELLVEQAKWDVKKGKLEFRLSLMSWTVCLTVLIAAVAAFAWSLAPVAEIMLGQKPFNYATWKGALNQALFALLITIGIAFIFEVARTFMGNIRWSTRGNLGDRPTDRNQSHLYPLSEINLYGVDKESFLATVNDWTFMVKVSKGFPKLGRREINMTFTEATAEKGMDFNSSVTAYGDMSDEDAIKSALSKAVHSYPELQSPAPNGRYGSK